MTLIGKNNTLRYIFVFVCGVIAGITLFFAISHIVKTSSRNTNTRSKFVSTGIENKNVKEIFIVEDVEAKPDEIPLFNPPTLQEKNDFLNKKDRGSFDELMTSYLYNDIEPEGILYALTAANKFDIAEGNYYIYLFLSGGYLSNEHVNDSIDERSKSWAMYYLERGMKKGDRKSKQQYDKIMMYEKQ